ncbi:hypothetical protein G4L39_06170 [Limisphaera ngatamarikiensis]|uniref:Uncharacterized protein n=1 Tax=Limisphaera ngatamarikiensis TaxID=1324935 RepID=A0A6M1RU97_9BACT|nr:hypothetical protein [Limisphaera ngatamarikiensis]NGO38981.1 hypothetical protein [Limisphaera ngatamarikiensis]
MNGNTMLRGKGMQLELDLGRLGTRRCSMAERRRARAAWWFAQMRRVVEEAARAAEAAGARGHMRPGFSAPRPTR